MKKYIFLFLLIYVIVFLIFDKQANSKTDKLLNDVSLIPDIELIESIFPNQEVLLKKDCIMKNEHMISQIFMTESDNYSSWLTNATYEITSIDFEPNLKQMYHYWNLKDDVSKIYEDETSLMYLIPNQNINGEFTDCLVGKLYNESINIYYFSYLKDNKTQAEIIDEIDELKIMFID